MDSPRTALEPEDPLADTLPLGDVVRATGLSAELLRAWERRYGAVEPIRTPGGSRRYRLEDVERLVRLKAAVDAGHRISEVSGWGAARWAQFLDAARPPTLPAADAILDALADLDGRKAEELLAFQLASLGPVAFAREIALPVLEAIGFMWTQRQACVAAEHLGSSLLRTMLGAALRPPPPRGAPRVLFTTLPEERHELGLLVAALVARGSGADPLYLGTELPVEEIAIAMRQSGAKAVALAVVGGHDEAWSPDLARLRALLDGGTPIWVGGAATGREALPSGVTRIAGLDELQALVSELVHRS